MDSVDHPLDWWAHGGYPAVVRELGCTKTQARRLVRAKIPEYFERTGNPLWRPIGNRGYAQLRRAIMENRAPDNELRWPSDLNPPRRPRSGGAPAIKRRGPGPT